MAVALIPPPGPCHDTAPGIQEKTLFVALVAAFVFGQSAFPQ